MSNNVYISQSQTGLSTQDKSTVDPLAQSFIIDTPGGAFLTSVNLYFAEKDETMPISIDIREMDNGLPSPVIVPYSQVTVTAENVNVSDAAAIATKFTFPSPVFLLDNAVYCFVVNANSAKYKIWAACTGGADVTRYPYSIIKEGFAGSVFRQQNTGAWNPDTTKDLKFDINRAEFVSSGTVVLNEATLPLVQLGDSPFETSVTSLTVTQVVGSGSNTVSATISDTSILTEAVSRITISGATGTQQTKLNGSWIVASISNSTTFTFAVGSSVSAGTYTTGLGTTVLGSPTVRVWHENHGFVAGTSQVTISGVEAGTYNGIPHSALNGTHDVISTEQDSYTFDITTLLNSGGALYASTSASRTGGTGIRSTENRTFDVLLPNIQNLTFQNTSADWSIKANTGKSLAGSESEYLLDSEFIPVTVHANNPMAHPRVIRSDSVTKSFILRGEFSTENRALSPVIDLNRASVVTINNRIDNPASTASAGYNAVHNYLPETTAIGSSALSKYITKKIDLSTPASALRAYVFVNRPAGSSISVYYKVLPKGSEANFDTDIGWSAVSATTDIPVSDDSNYFSEAEYAIDETALNDSEFTSFAFKVVFTATNSSAVPMLKSFRAIAVT